MRPTSGHIQVSGNVSWPVGFAGSFHGDLTGVQNTRFVARIYGVDSNQLVDFVWEFSELADKLRMPLRSYSQGMRARLAFAISMGVDFDTYLIDEISAVGDAAFRQHQGDGDEEGFRQQPTLFLGGRIRGHHLWVIDSLAGSSPAYGLWRKPE